MSATFGKRLRDLRKKKNISQESITEMLNITNAMISRYKNNKQEPTINIVEQLADYFGTSIDYILGKSEVKDSHWYKKLPPKLQNFIIKENIKYLEVAFKAKEENWSPEAMEELINVIKSFNKS